MGGFQDRQFQLWYHRQVLQICQGSMGRRIQQLSTWTCTCEFRMHALVRLAFLLYVGGGQQWGEKQCWAGMKGWVRSLTDCTQGVAVETLGNCLLMGSQPCLKFPNTQWDSHFQSQHTVTVWMPLKGLMRVRTRSATRFSARYQSSNADDLYPYFIQTNFVCKLKHPGRLCCK